MNKFTIAIHGGAGTILKENLTAELEEAHRQGLQEALDAGYEVLMRGGTAIDAVKASVISLEDNILFNAGRGAVFTKDGTHELDAAIMDGSDLKCGAIAGIKNVRNPIDLAHRVMLHTDHILLAGAGASEFAKKQGIPHEPEDYFFSAYRYKQWESTRDSDKTILDHTAHDKKFGTVGAVACDAHGNIAAATSTGGMTNKKYGRVGDSPLIGCGTYANNKTCAISCTGHGEAFIRAVAAYDVSCLMEYKGMSLEEAMHIVVQEKLISIDGEGGIIGVDAKGNAALIFNSAGMYRGVRNNEGLNNVAIFQ